MKQEQALQAMLMEALAIFEGGDCIEDFSSSFCQWIVSDVSDSLYRWYKILERKQDGDGLLSELRGIIDEQN